MNAGPKSVRISSASVPKMPAAKVVRNVRKPRASLPSVPRVVTEAPMAPRGESRTMRVLRTLLGVVMVAAIGGGVAWGARRYIKTSPRFGVTEIVTMGEKHRTADELAVLAGVSKGQNVFSLDLDRGRARLVADPWISEAQVTRQLPGTVTIRVTEREAAGVVATSDGTYLVTREGLIIKRAEAGDPFDFHVVTGVPLQQLVDDREGAARTIRRALDLASDYDHSPLGQRSPAEEVHVEGNGDLTLLVGKTTVTLRMGAPPYRRKIEQATRVVAELDRRGAKPDAIMLDDEARQDRVVVRMR